MDIDPVEFLNFVPHNRELGFKLVKISEEELLLEMPYQKKLVGDPETGVIAGGAVTSLLDTACGIAVVNRLTEMRGVSTIDLRIDYLRAAVPGKALIASASCYRITHHVGFARGIAYHADEEGPVANATGIFSLSELNVDELTAKYAGGNS